MRRERVSLDVCGQRVEEPSRILPLAAPDENRFAENQERALLDRMLRHDRLFENLTCQPCRTFRVSPQPERACERGKCLRMPEEGMRLTAGHRRRLAGGSHTTRLVVLLREHLISDEVMREREHPLRPGRFG